MGSLQVDMFRTLTAKFKGLLAAAQWTFLATSARPTLAHVRTWANCRCQSGDRKTLKTSSGTREQRRETLTMRCMSQSQDLWETHAVITGPRWKS